MRPYEGERSSTERRNPRKSYYPILLSRLASIITYIWIKSHQGCLLLLILLGAIWAVFYFEARSRLNEGTASLMAGMGWAAWVLFINNLSCSTAYLSLSACCIVGVAGLLFSLWNFFLQPLTNGRKEFRFRPPHSVLTTLPPTRPLLFFSSSSSNHP